MALLRGSQWEPAVRLIGSDPTRWGDKDGLEPPDSEVRNLHLFAPVLGYFISLLLFFLLAYSHEPA